MQRNFTARPEHLSTSYIVHNAAYCDRWSRSVVSVSLSVGRCVNAPAPRKNGWTDRGPVWRPKAYYYCGDTMVRRDLCQITLASCLRDIRNAYYEMTDLRFVDLVPELSEFSDWKPAVVVVVEAFDKVQRAVLGVMQFVAQDSHRLVERDVFLPAETTQTTPQSCRLPQSRQHPNESVRGPDAGWRTLLSLYICNCNAQTVRLSPCIVYADPHCTCIVCSLNPGQNATGQIDTRIHTHFYAVRTRLFLALTLSNPTQFSSFFHCWEA